MKHLMLGLVALFCLSTPATAVEKWWDARWEARISVTVEAAEGVLPKRPVIIRWGDIAGKAAGAGYLLSSLRLVANGNPVPFQVDHLDAAGHFVGEKDFSLDPQDEIVFVAPAKTRSVLYLYMSKTPMPPPQFPSGVSATATRNSQSHYRLSSGGLTTNVQGTGLLDLSAALPANYGQASVVGLTWKGRSMTGQGSNWSVVMNSCPFPSGPENRWSAVKLVVNGPVRKIVSTSCLDSTIKAADGSVALNADVTRYFSMLAGVPVYDVEDVIECTAAKGEWVGTYSDRLVLGHRPQLDDVLLDGSSGTPRRVVLTDKSIPLTPDGRLDGVGGLVETPSVNDGWYAWVNEKDKLGLAVFYGTGRDANATPSGQLGFSAGWAMWQMNNSMSFSYTGLQPPTILRHRFRVIAMGSEKPDSVAREYRAWESAAIKVGSVERRKP